MKNKILSQSKNAVNENIIFINDHSKKQHAVIFKNVSKHEKYFSLHIQSVSFKTLSCQHQINSSIKFFK